MVRDPRFELGEVRGTVLRMDWLGCLTSAPLGQIEVFA